MRGDKWSLCADAFTSYSHVSANSLGSQYVSLRMLQILVIRLNMSLLSINKIGFAESCPSQNS